MNGFCTYIVSGAKLENKAMMGREVLKAIEGQYQVSKENGRFIENFIVDIV